jgi:hypothetical protein
MNVRTIYLKLMEERRPLELAKLRTSGTLDGLLDLVEARAEEQMSEAMGRANKEIYSDRYKGKAWEGIQRYQQLVRLEEELILSDLNAEVQPEAAEPDESDEAETPEQPDPDEWEEGMDDVSGAMMASLTP